MNQRSTSAMRKLRTQMSSERWNRTNKQVKDKDKKIRQQIANTPRLYPSAHNFHIQNRTHQKKWKIPAKQKQTNKIRQYDAQEYCMQKGLVEGQCVRHPHKQAVFQSRGDNQLLLCHQCAIAAVKLNIKVSAISSQSLFLASLLRQQMTALTQQQTKAHKIIADHYQTMRQLLQAFYSRSHQQLAVKNNILFGQFKQSSMLDKISECLGKIEDFTIHFQSQIDKQNVNLSANDVSINLKLDKQIFFDRKHEHSHSIESVRVRHNYCNTFARCRQISHNNRGQQTNRTLQLR